VIAHITHPFGHVLLVLVVMGFAFVIGWVLWQIVVVWRHGR